MNILMSVLYILLFIFCLSFLIVIHELGHLAAAKVFKVYCLEFSIGFGPAFYKHKKKGHETQFSLRSIPFGGYVSMYGEGVELPEGEVVDNSRSLNGIKKWKRAIILVAGVTMNALLALTLFFVDEAFIPQNKYSPFQFELEENSPLKSLGIADGQILHYAYDDNEHGEIFDQFSNSNVFFIDLEGKLHKDAIDPVSKEAIDEAIDVFAIFNASDLSFKDLRWEKYIEFYPAKFDENNVPTLNANEEITKYKYVDFNFSTYANADEYRSSFTDGNVATKYPFHYVSDISLGASFRHLKMTCFDNGDNPVKLMFKDFGEASTVIVRGLGMMFKKENWNQMGGIVAIGFETTNTLQNLGLYYFIYIWAMISVNLAIVNLIPFPGLDGWQLLVVIVEAITHKTIPEKVKNIVSFIGIALLFGLMIVILFKDVFKYIFLGLL